MWWLQTPSSLKLLQRGRWTKRVTGELEEKAKDSEKLQVCIWPVLYGPYLPPSIHQTGKALGNRQHRSDHCVRHQGIIAGEYLDRREIRKAFLSGSVGPVWGDGGERPDVDGQRSVSTLQGKAVNFHQYSWFNWDTFWFKIACRPSWLIIEVDTLGQKLENQAGWSEVEKGDVCSQLWCTGCKDWTLAWCCTDWKEWGRVSFIPPIFIQRQCLTWWKGCWVGCVKKWKIFQGTTWRCPWLNRIGSLL